jgi:hypothetical protein
LLASFSGLLGKRVKMISLFWLQVQVSISIIQIKHVTLFTSKATM